MDELSLIICSIGKAIDHAIVYGHPADELQKAYDAAVKLKSELSPK